jgi:hypothetical protein
MPLSYFNSRSLVKNEVKQSSMSEVRFSTHIKTGSRGDDSDIAKTTTANTAKSGTMVKNSASLLNSSNPWLQNYSPGKISGRQKKLFHGKNMNQNRFNHPSDFRQQVYIFILYFLI